ADGYAMPSNYKSNPRPAVVFVENGHSQVAIKRESFEDLVHLDEPFHLSD
ncbi:MAG: diaminopimelate decarboxylase, partial [Lentilactobacillus diolivorans]